MKRTILKITMSLALCAALLQAQGGRRGGGRMLDELGLTDEQRPKVEAILKEQREAMKAVREKDSSRKEMRAIQEQTQQKLKAVLSEEQMKKLEDARGKRGRKKQ